MTISPDLLENALSLLIGECPAAEVADSLASQLGPAEELLPYLMLCCGGSERHPDLAAALKARAVETPGAKTPRTPHARAQSARETTMAELARAQRAVIDHGLAGDTHQHACDMISRRFTQESEAPLPYRMGVINEGGV